MQQQKLAKYCVHEKAVSSGKARKNIKNTNSELMRLHNPTSKTCDETSEYLKVPGEYTKMLTVDRTLRSPFNF